MKSALILTAISLLVVAVRGCDASETTGGYVQNPSGNASFTSYANCGNPGKQHELASTGSHTLSTAPPQHVVYQPPATRPR